MEYYKMCYPASNRFIHKFMHQGGNGRVQDKWNQEEERKNTDDT